VNGSGVQLTGGGNDIYLTKLTMSGVANQFSASGIDLIFTGAVNITDCDIIRHGNSLNMHPGNGQSVLNVWADNSYFDSATTGVSMKPTGTGVVQFIRLNGCWTSSHVNQGIDIGSTGNVVGVELIALQCYNNAGNGIAIAGGSDYHILGGIFCGNVASGISISPNVNSFSIVGARIGSGYSKPGNAYGIYIAPGTSNEYIIVGNNLGGNTVANFSDGGTGSLKTITGNIGVTDGATLGISVTASPFTYISGALPEMVYVNGGTVSSVAVNGTNVFGQSNVSVLALPNSTVVVTYTVAPTMNKTINNA
jgi:hypothetical protein